MKLLKRTWADVSLDNLAHNYTVLRRQVPAACRFLGVVKADAYGHGAVPVSHHLEELGAEFLAVSNLEEAVQLRRAEVRRPILILGYTRPSMPGSWRRWICARRFTAWPMPGSWRPVCWGPDPGCGSI